MEFLCLNCFATFEIEDDKLPAPGELLTCPNCGHQQPFAGVKTTGKHTSVSGGTSSKRRMSQEYKITYNTGPGIEEKPKDLNLFVDTHPHEEKSNETPVTAFRVVSPSDITFEFTDKETLLRWGEMVSNPTPYKVYKGDDAEPISLAQYLEDNSTISKVRRRSAKMKDAVEAELAAKNESPSEPDVKSENKSPQPPKEIHKEEKQPDEGTGPRTTSQFQFKTGKVEEKKFGKVLLYLLITLFAGASLVVLYLYVFQGGL